MLLAVEAYERDPNPETRAALFAANTASPHLERFLDAGGKVERLGGSSDGDVVAGLADGRVLLWRAGAGEPQQLFRLERRISSLAVSADGSVVAAADRAQGSVWQEGEGVSGLPVPVGEHTDQVALSPSGETLVYHALLPGYEEGGSITVASTSAPEAGRVHPLSPSDLGYGALFVVPSEQRMLMMIGGSWRWRRLSDWALLMSSEGGFGAHQYGQAISADGRFFTATNGAQVVPVWPTSKPTSDLGTSDLGVEAPITDQRVLALSPDGSKVAVAGGEGIFVAPVATASELRPDSFDAVEASSPEMDPILLTGQGSSGLLSFVDDMHLLSAAGAEIAVWDLAQVDRLAGRTTVPLMPGCSACPPADIAISPDGERIAVTDDYGSSGFVQSLRHPDREELPESEFRWGTPVWAGDGDFAAFPVYPSFGAPEIPADLPEDVRAWQGAAGERDVLSATTAADGRTAIFVDEKGHVYWQDVETGEQLGHLGAPDSLSLGGETLDGAAVSSSPEMAALVDDGKVIVEELPSGRELAHIEAGDFATAAFAGDRLLVQRRDGALEVWSRQGSTLQRTLAGDENYAYEPVGSRDGRMVARRRSDGSVVLVDLDTGAELAAFRTREPSSFLRTSVAFAPDGERLYMLSEMSGEGWEAELVGRDISEEALMANACRAAGRDLTAREWQAFVGGDPPSDLSCG